MPRDQDLRYAIRVQDAQLKELQRNIRALNRDLKASETTASTAGAATAASYDKAGKSAKGAAAGATVFGRSTKDALKLGAGSFAAFATLEGVAQLLRGSVPAALEAERSTKRLETQLENLGIARADNVERIEKEIRASTLLAGVIDDELIRDSYVNLLRSTRNVTKATELNNLAMDIAIAKNISLETASRLVARVYAGNVGALGRYGITIDKNATSTEALTTLQDRFAGQAQAAGLTAEGSFGKFAFRLEELQEQLGAAIIPLLLDATETATDFITVVERLSALTADVKGKAGDLIPDVPGGGFLGDMLGEAREWGLILNPQGPFKTGAKVLDLLAGSTEKAAEEFSMFDRIAAGVGETLDGVGASAQRMQAGLERGLKRELLSALEDVQKKALATFDSETDALVAGHDKVTDSLASAFDRAADEQLARFDKTTDELVKKLRVVVKAGGEQFTIGREQKTPAERELAALEKIEAKRTNARDLRDAREALGQAQLIGDPHAIRDAKRAVEDAELETRKTKLEGQATTQRKAADKALAAAEDSLQQERDALRDDLERKQDMERRSLEQRRSALRADLAKRRSIQRENLSNELDAIGKAMKNGKRAAANAQKQILATLRKFGVEYKGVGTELGGKFLEGFAKALQPPKQKGKGTKALPGTVDPKTGILVPPWPWLPATGAARGGLAGQLGKRGPSDTIVAGLTPGEMILTKGDQRGLARQLGASTIGWPLLSKIRMGFAEGGVADEHLLRMLLQRFSANLSQNAVKGGNALADPRVLTGKIAAPNIPHLQSLVKRSIGAEKYLGMNRGTKVELLNRLASRQAHPIRSGLATRDSSGAYRPGSHFRDPGSTRGPFDGSGASITFGDLNFNDGGQTVYAMAEQVRREFISTARRNGRVGPKRRGKNKGSTVVG